MNKSKNQAAVELGRLGGKAGRGAAKRRSPEHYEMMARKHAEKMDREWAQQEADKLAQAQALVAEHMARSATLTPKTDQETR